jgi:hypothetical protein
MSEALKYHKLNEAREDCQFAIRKLMEACKEMPTDLQQELIILIFNATDREICFEGVI